MSASYSRRKADDLPASNHLVEPLEGRRMLSVSPTPAYSIDGIGGNGQAGTALDARGEWVLLGQPKFDDPDVADTGFGEGQAFLENTTTGDRVVIANPSPLNYDQFGAAVAILGNGKIAVSSLDDGALNAGTVFIYDAPFISPDDNSPPPLQLTAPTKVLGGSVENARFGFRIAAFQTDSLLIYTDDLGASSEASGVGMYNTTTNTSIGAFDVVGATSAGRNMAVDGNRAVFSYALGDVTKVGEAVFNGSSWEFVNTYEVLAAPLGSGDHALALSGTNVLVGSVDDDVVYHFDTTVSDTFPIKSYAAPSGPTGQSSLFGAALAIVGDSVVITDPSTQVARAYVYSLADNDANSDAPDTAAQTLGAGLGDLASTFGTVVAATGDGRFVVSDPFKDNGAGAAYVFEFEDETPVNQAPVVSAGSDATVTLPGSAGLDGSASDDGLPTGSLVTTWSVVSGPGTVAFADASAVDTAASFSAAGTYVLRLTASDGSLLSKDDVTITVAPEPPPPGPTQPIELFNGILYVTAPLNAAANAISITGNSSVTVTMGAQTLTVPASAITGGRIEVRGGNGADVIAVANSVHTSVWVFGGGGIDLVRGGGGDDVLIGGDGLDLLVGSNGRDLLVGGNGFDRLVGEAQDDILVAGSTVYDAGGSADLAAIASIMSIWSNRAETFTSRVDTLKDNLLDPATKVSDDGVPDLLTGNGGSDWFIYAGGSDVITDLRNPDFASDLEFINGG